MAIGTILTGVGYTIGNIGSLFGGDGDIGCTQADHQRRQKIAQAIRTYLTPGDMQQLVAGMEGRVPPDASSMADFFVGEHDCKHKNVGPRHQRFLTELPQMIQQRRQEVESTGQISGPTPSLQSGMAGGGGGGFFAGLGEEVLLVIALIGLAIGGFAYYNR